MFAKLGRSNKSQSKSLTEQLGKNCSNLPVRVRVTSCHETLQKYSISKESVLDFYSIKTVKVAIARSSQGTLYTIPFDTQVKLSPLYNPENDLKKALNGYRFTNILQLYRHGTNRPRPVLVYALSGILGSSHSTSMECDDVYALEENGVSNDGQKALLCKDISSSELEDFDNAKAFPMHLQCDLTTDPQKLSFHPSVFFDYLKLPAELVMIDNSSQTSTVLTVTQFSSIEFIVAGIDQGYYRKKKIIQIYNNVDMEIQALEHCASEANLLRFNADSAASQYQTRIMDERYVLDAIQLQFLAYQDSVSKPGPVEHLPQTVFTPPVIRRKPVQSQLSTQTSNRSSSLIQSNVGHLPRAISTPPVIRRKPVHSQLSTQSLRSSSFIRSNVGHLSRTVSTPPAIRHEPVHSQVSTQIPNRSSMSVIQSNVGEHEYETIPDWCYDSNEEIGKQFQYNPLEGCGIYTIPHSPISARASLRPETTKAIVNPLAPELTILEENQKILAKCSPEDVANILDNLGMSKYREMFLSEQIHGSLLMELDEDILEHELHIDRKLDRIKLLQIVKGTNRVTNLM